MKAETVKGLRSAVPSGSASSKSPTRSSRRKRTTITEAKGDKQDPTPSTPKISKKKSTLNKELTALEVPALDVAVGKRRTRSTRKRSDSMYTEHNEYDISDEDMISDAQVEDDHDEDLKAKRATPRRAKRRRQDEDSEEAPSPKPKKRRKKVHEARIHLRLIPAEEEPKVREQIIREEVELLTCDELLVPDKESNVNLQQAKCNVDFEEMFLDFLIFKRVYGHALVPKHFEENKPLGRWCCKIRNWKNKGKSNLTASRERRLNAAGFCWDAKKNPDFWKLQNTCKQGQDRWEDFFGRLLEYKKENGNCIVPKECKGKHRQLSRWVSKIRKEYRMKQRGGYHTLTDEREKRLVEVGFVFNTKESNTLRDIIMRSYSANWNGYLERLVKFKKKHGHCRVPRRHPEDQSLASWVMRQRNHYRKMKAGIHSYMTEERLERLQEVGFCFSVGKGGQRGEPVDDEDDPSFRYYMEKGKQEATNSDSENEESELEDGGEGDDDNEDEDTHIDSDDDRKPAGKRKARALEEDGSDDDETITVGSNVETLAKSETGGNFSATVSAESNSSDDASNVAAEDPAVKQETEVEIPTIKGEWKCEHCGKDEFTCFVEAMAHECECRNLSTVIPA